MFYFLFLMKNKINSTHNIFLKNTMQTTNIFNLQILDEKQQMCWNFAVEYNKSTFKKNNALIIDMRDSTYCGIRFVKRISNSITKTIMDHDQTIKQ